MSGRSIPAYPAKPLPWSPTPDDRAMKIPASGPEDLRR